MADKEIFKDFSQVFDYIVQSTNYENKTDYRYTRDVFDLKRVRECLHDLENPDKDMDIIHIAGTKGKGSVAFMVSAILNQAGYRVGRFISPHLLRINERISVDQSEISDAEFVQMMNILYPYLKRAREEGNPLTFFDIITILALVFFSHKGVDFAVLETGLGGRLDSTNVVSPEACVITSIGYDHMDKLGDTLEAIAAEKAGIIKEKVPVILGTERPNVVDIIEKTALSKSAPLFQIGRHFRPIVSPKKSVFEVETWRKLYPELVLPLLGDHQLHNAAIAIAALDSLYERDIASFSVEQARKALANLTIPGRIEIISQNPTVVLDVAHNPASLLALSDALEDQFPNKRKVFLFGMLQDKDIKRSLKSILSIASKIVFTTCESPRSENPKKLSKVARGLGFPEISVESDIESAFKLALGKVGRNDLLCITGSTYLAGRVLRLIGNERAYEFSCKYLA